MRPVGLPALVDEIGLDIIDVLFTQHIVEALHAGRRYQAAQHDVLERRLEPRVELAQVRRNAWAQHVAARTFLDKFHFTSPDTLLIRALLGRLRKGLIDTRWRRGHRATAELEGYDAVGVLVTMGGAAGRNRPYSDRRTTVTRLHGNKLHTIDGVGHRRRHDVAAGLDDLQHFSRVGGVNPQFTVTAALKYQVASGAHDATIVTAHAEGSFMLPDTALCHRIPGPDEFTHALAATLAFNGFQIW